MLKSTCQVCVFALVIGALLLAVSGCSKFGGYTYHEETYFDNGKKASEITERLGPRDTLGADTGIKDMAIEAGDSGIKKFAMTGYKNNESDSTANAFNTINLLVQEIVKMKIAGIAAAAIPAGVPAVTATVDVTDSVEEPEESESESDADEGESNPLSKPEATIPVTYSSDGCEEHSWKGGAVWNGNSSRGTKVVLPSSLNGKVGWVAVWGDGFEKEYALFGSPEEGNRSRWYGPKCETLPESVLVRVHIPGATDWILAVANPCEKYR